MPGDLHCHTTYSDGSTQMNRLLQVAAADGLRYLAVSDHDSALSAAYAYAHPDVNGVSLIPAAELSAYDYRRQRRVHILVYYPDLNEPFHDHCAYMARQRNAAAERCLPVLLQKYPQISLDSIRAMSADSGVIFKSSIMQELRQLGFTDKLYGSLYHSLLSESGIAPYKVTYHSVEAVLALAKQCRAVTVFAHPSVYQSMELVAELAEKGLIDGIEVNHPRNTEQDKAQCLALCRKYHLICTGGTDFHGCNTDSPHPLGTCVTPDETITEIQRLAAHRKEQT